MLIITVASKHLSQQLRACGCVIPATFVDNYRNTKNVSRSQCTRVTNGKLPFEEKTGRREHRRREAPESWSRGKEEMFERRDTQASEKCYIILASGKKKANISLKLLTFLIFANVREI